MNVFPILLALIWIIPAVLRVWRLARFYQMEEYKSNRFLRWLFDKRDRWFPRPRAVVMLAAIIISYVLQFVDIGHSLVHFGMWALVAIIFSQPPQVKETKKEFVRTDRATRILATAFVLVALFIGGVGLLLGTSNDAGVLSSVAIVGFIGFLLAPLALVVGNALMYPVEQSLRNRFRRNASAKLAATGAKVIGVTGSYGKTSTKVYLHHILSGKYRTYATPKSYNTIMGVSLAINTDMQDTPEYFIAEMGAYVPGEIAGICELTNPQMSIVTAVGPMHLERFGTIDNVVKAKYEIVEGVPASGTTVFNGDDPRVRGMAERGHPNTRVLISREGLPEARLLAENIQQSFDGLSFDVLDRETDTRATFKTSLLGLHTVTNILLASAVALLEGMTLDQIAERITSLEPAEHRLNIIRNPSGITVIDDAYSANPVGAISALEVLKLSEGGRRIVITPGMIELGDLQEEENQKLGAKLTEYATDIVLVGKEITQPLQAGIAETDFDAERVLVTDTFDEAREWFQAHAQMGDTVLFLNDLPDTYL